MRERILIIEDDEDISEILKFSLKKEGYEVKANPKGLDTEKEIIDFKPELILLDVMLNDTDGFSICRNIRSYNIPIIFLTARDEIIDKILGLEMGAEDYITKPFDIREVIARIRVVLRRNNSLEDLNSLKNKEVELLTFKEIEVNEALREVKKENDIIKLKPKEYDLLLHLIKNKNRIFTREELLDSIWGYDFLGDSRTVDIHITRLRKLIGSSYIKTVFGVGYVFKE